MPVISPTPVLILWSLESTIQGHHVTPPYSSRDLFIKTVYASYGVKAREWGTSVLRSDLLLHQEERHRVRHNRP